MNTIEYEDEEDKNQVFIFNNMPNNKHILENCESLNNPSNPFIIANNIINDKNNLSPQNKEKNKNDTNNENKLK